MTDRTGADALHFLCLAALALVVFAAPSGAAEDPPPPAPTGHVMLMGGNVRPDNAAVYRTFVALAGGERARIGVIPTAGIGLQGGLRLAETLAKHGAVRDRIAVLDITTANAAANVRDPAVVAQIRGTTGLFFTGGDQRRIAEAFVGPGGVDTPALAAIREVHRRGGVVGGSSAGAAVMAGTMLAASGDPIDTLDYGIAPAPYQRGVTLQPGLGFFRVGLVDQHFNTFDGRLGRLARVQAATGASLGFGVDENTAAVLGPSGLVEVVGPGGMTVVDASGSSVSDGPLGVTLSGLVLHYLEAGDAFDPAARRCKVHEAKRPIPRGTEAEIGNKVITDLGQKDAVKRAVLRGLVNSSASRQIGLLLKVGETYGHGYRFTFTETDATRGYEGRVDGIWSYAAESVAFEVRPTTLDLRAPSPAFPRDLAAASGPSRTIIQAIAFRGVLEVDAEGDFQPARAVTRGEFAAALTRVAGLDPRPGPRPQLADVPRASPFADAVLAVAASGVMDLSEGRFRPDDPVTRDAVADALARAVVLSTTSRSVDPPPAAGAPAVPTNSRADFLDAMPPGPSRPTDPATREDVALAVARFLKSPWK